MLQAIKCDLHIHSNFSDGKHSIKEIVDLYGKKGFGAIAITDHLCERKNLIGRFSHGLNYSLSIVTFKPYMDEIENQARRALSEYGMLVIPGFEITKNSFTNHRSAHILVLGTREYIDPEQSVESILIKAKKLGALTIAAHPFDTGAIEFQTFHLWSKRFALNELIDVWEVNCRKNISSVVLNSGLRLIANSDFHHLKHFSSWKTKIYSEPKIDAIFNSIKAQKIDFFFDS